MTKTVLVAGATGYLGRYFVAEYMQREGWTVIAVVRNKAKASSLNADTLIEAEVTKPETLSRIMDGVDVVISAVGITRQRDGVTYQDVDYQANMNLLKEAMAAKVPHFCYIHVLHGTEMAHLPAIQAKQDFVNHLEQAQTKGDIQKTTVVSPCGFFSDMKDFLDMAKGGRAWLFGNGSLRINPIHGEDLAHATAEAIAQAQSKLDIGGPDILSQTELAELAFAALNRPPKITYVWDKIRIRLIQILPWIAPLKIYGPAQFFLTAMGMDMVGECHGKHHLKDHFAQIVRDEKELTDLYQS